MGEPCATSQPADRIYFESDRKVVFVHANSDGKFHRSVIGRNANRTIPRTVRHDSKAEHLAFFHIES